MTDKGTIRAVVILLGLFALVGLSGMIYLIDRETEADMLAILAGPMGTALGALASILVSTRSQSAEPQEVIVANPPGDPVVTAEAPAKAKRRG